MSDMVDFLFQIFKAKADDDFLVVICEVIFYAKSPSFPEL